LARPASALAFGIIANMILSRRKRLGAALIWASVVIAISDWYFGVWQVAYQIRQDTNAGYLYLVGFVVCLALMLTGGLYLLFSRGKDSK